MKIAKLLTVVLFTCIASYRAEATVYTLPETPGDTVVTTFTDNLPLTKAEKDQTLLDTARDFLLGQVEIVRLNQDLDRWHIKKGSIIRLPNKRILPDTPHEGITLNISEYRMYYYPADRPGEVWSFAHGVGRQDWKTPLGRTTVAKKVKDPAWHPPESIRREHAANGDPLPAIVPPGPHNPLGAYALYLNLPGDYRIHGTDIDKIYGIGMQITHGCVRMYPEDIENLYQSVPLGTPVHLVKQPIKVGWLNNVLYIEAHPDLEGDELTQDQRYSLALDLIKKAIGTPEIPEELDQVVLTKALKDLEGDPVALYEREPPPVVPVEQVPVSTPTTENTPTSTTPQTTEVKNVPVVKPIAIANSIKPKPAKSSESGYYKEQ